MRERGIKMKKHNTFKVLGIILVLVLITSYFLIGKNDAREYVGILDVTMNSFKSVYYFFYLFQNNRLI